MTAAQKLQASLRKHASPEKAQSSQTFFKIGPGQYAEGDQFLGISTPQIRKLVAQQRDLSLIDCRILLESPWHEERMAALITLVERYKRGASAEKQSIYDLYLASTPQINNWDLVDVSARDIVGAHVFNRPLMVTILDSLAESELLWERRIAIVATHHFIMNNCSDATIHIARMLLHDQEDLIQKATGWMLREMGKRVSADTLVVFLRDHYNGMSRTTLRYAIEHFEPEIRKRYMLGNFTV
jgi:3-methyladenine DNA glycosylase AlkD